MAENSSVDSRFGEQARLAEPQTYADSLLSADVDRANPSRKTDAEVIFPNGGIRFFYWAAAGLTALAICIQIGLHTFWENPELHDEEKIQNCQSELRRIHNYAKQMAKAAACVKLEEEFVRKYNFEPE